MSQISSATSPFAQQPAVGSGPGAERAGDAATFGDGFAALLAGLFPPPVAAAPVAAPATPGRPAAAVSPLFDHASAEAGGGDWLPSGGGHEEPLEVAPSPAPAAAGDPRGGAATGSPRGGAAAGDPRGGVAPAGDAEAPASAPDRGAPDPLGSLGRAESGAADLRRPADGSLARPTAGEAKAGAVASERAAEARRQNPSPAPGLAPAAAVEGRPAERRPAGGRAAERAGAEAGTGRGEATDRQPAAGSARPTAPVEQPLGASQILAVGRLALAVQVDPADRWESVSAPGLAGADGVADRPASTTIEPAAGATARPVQQLALAIGRMAKGELRQLTFQLSPRDLGTIEISLELDADRRLTVAILAERPETLDLLRQDARQLERLLGQQGTGLGDGGLELGLMSEHRRDGRERPPAEALDLPLPDEAAGDAEPGHAPPALQFAAARHRLNLSI